MRLHFWSEAPHHHPEGGGESAAVMRSGVARGEQQTREGDVAHLRRLGGEGACMERKRALGESMKDENEN